MAQISIVMPVYNAEKYLPQAIQSMLNQTYKDFELLCIDDESKDKSAQICAFFHQQDPRVKYYKVKHSGIVNALNFGISIAEGKYIARMDADDISLEDRLEYQYNFMEEHPDIDVLGGGFLWWYEDKKIEDCKGFGLDSDVDIQMLLKGNRLGHPTVMMRKESILKLPYIYEQYYQEAEDYKLWFTCLTHGLKLHTDGKLVLLYRQHEGQTKMGQGSRQDFLNKVIIKAYTSVLEGVENDPEAKLTVIIPYQNEEEEIERTICNIRGTTDHVNIILINDMSDPFDYATPAKIFHCEYHEEIINRGVAGSRDFGISLSKTENFVLLDGHMRFNNFKWEDTVNTILKSNPKCILTSNTYVISRTEEHGFKEYTNDHGQSSHATSLCAALDEREGWEMNATWVYKTLDNVPEKAKIIPVACVLGAFYASTKTHWNNILGLRGLKKYGLDETMMSVKTWEVGGTCLMLRDFFVGHYYRPKNPYPISRLPIDTNQLYCINLFCNPHDIEIYTERMKKRLGEEKFQEVVNNFDAEECAEHRKLYEPKIVHNIDWFMKINSKVPQKKEDKKEENE